MITFEDVFSRFFLFCTLLRALTLSFIIFHLSFSEALLRAWGEAAFLQKLAQIIKFFVFILLFVFDFLDSFVYYCFRLYLLFYFCQSDNLFGQSNKN
jgi:hypothetical protein